MPTTQPLNVIVDVTVVTSSPQVAAPSFNKGIVIGSSTTIPSYGANSRTREYLQANWSAAMLSDGFTNNNPEYIAMGIYFAQSPPPSAGYVGRQDLTAISTATPAAGEAGTGYAVGDLVSVAQGGASFGQLKVTTIGVSGSVTALSVVVQGTGYSVANGLATTAITGSGTGLEIDVTAIGESCLQAFQACRTQNPNWYPGMVCTAVDADHIAISAWTSSQVGTIYMGTTQQANLLNGIANNVGQTIFAASGNRTWLQYATTQSGLYPNQIYFVAAVMGQMMASNTQLANSSFTEKFSGGVPLVGVVTEPNLTTTNISNIEGSSTSTGPNVNLFLNYANAFNVLEQGTMMAENVFLDQVLGLDVLAANIQYAVMNLLTSSPKIPQTDAGQTLLIQAVKSALASSAVTGFIAPGIWEGQNILNQLPAGTPLPTGYAVLSPRYSTLTQAQIQARQAPPIYVALIEAGAVHFVTIAVQVQL